MCESIAIVISILLLFHSWLEHLRQLLDTNTLHWNEIISLPAYYSSHQALMLEDSNVALTSLLPLFHEQAKSVAMIRHSMDIAETAVETLNTGQVPVITCDQPLYALAKQIKWNWQTTHGENHFVVMFGGLHIEMATL